MEEFVTKRIYDVAEAKELSIDFNGYNFLVIVGKHKNGWFIAIPNWNACTEAVEPENADYNAVKLERTNRIPVSAANVIADEIKRAF